jgi:exodeoxyribonuclease VII small subunit
MAKKTEPTFDYQAKSAELEQILVRLQDADIAVDEAGKLHAAGLLLVKELEAYLKQAENEVRRHVATDVEVG